ncbi:MAG: hypothetical protein HOW73_19680 [Polyangiaceae bacterium]|nr:hypothetical protein [Polyangiaceae bacterium]
MAALASRLSGGELGGHTAHVTATSDGNLRIDGAGVTTVNVRFVPGQERPVDHTVGTVNLGAYPELRIAEGTDLELATPAIAAALSELHNLFRQPPPGTAPTGATHLGPINGVLEIGNLTGGHVVIGSLSGAVFLQQVTAIGNSINTSEPPPGPASAGLLQQAESALGSTLGPDRVHLGDVTSGDIYIESVTGAIVVNGEVRNPGHLTVSDADLTRLDIEGMDVVHTQISVADEAEMDRARRELGAIGSIFVAVMGGDGRGQEGIRVAGIGGVQTGGLTGVQLREPHFEENFTAKNVRVVGIHVQISSSD